MGGKVYVQSILFENDSPPSHFTRDDLVRFQGCVKLLSFIFILKILIIYDKIDNLKSSSSLGANSTTYTVLVTCTILAIFSKF